MRRLPALALSVLFSLVLIQWVHSKATPNPVPLALGQQWVEQDLGFWEVLDQAWTLKADSKVFASLMTHKNSTIAKELTRESLPTFLSEFKKGRLAVLKLQDITDWEIAAHSFESEGEVKTLRIAGSYHDVEKQHVQFQEVHVFEGAKYAVFSLIYPANSDFANSENAPVEPVQAFLNSRASLDHGATQ